jgi:hypothetical protein
MKKYKLVKLIKKRHKIYQNQNKKICLKVKCHKVRCYKAKCHKAKYHKLQMVKKKLFKPLILMLRNNDKNDPLHDHL